jgi:iron complex transport system substrate-binding protein
MARRIASLLSAATEMLFALGLGDRVVAVSHECDWPLEANRLPRVTISHIAASASSAAIDTQVRERASTGKPLYGLDVELLGRLTPDLIVTQQQCDVCAVSYADILTAVACDSRLAGCRIVALNPQGLGDVLADLRRVGEAAGAPAAAELSVAALEARIETVRCRTARTTESERPRFVCVEWSEPLMLAANWVPEIVELAGGRNGLSIGGRHSTYHAWSDVLAYDPEVIVVSPCGFDLHRTLDEALALASVPGWGKMTAVRTGRVYAVNGNAYLNRSGPRLVDSLEILAHLLHPNLIATPTDAAAGWCVVPR